MNVHPIEFANTGVRQTQGEDEKQARARARAEAEERKHAKETNGDDDSSDEEDEEDDDDDDEYEYEYEEEELEQMTIEEHALIVTAILKPVAITMLLVILVILTTKIPRTSRTTVVWMVYQENSADSNVTKLAGSLLNALIFVCMIVLVTVILVLLFKYRCMKIIYGWLIGSTGLLLGFFGALLLALVCYGNNIPIDWITFSFVLWNFMVGGMVSVFWYAPAMFTQGYLIAVSALLAIFFTRLPEWTTWSILIAVAVYDIFAVLCPRGPLRVLVDIAEERQEPIPALLYNGSAILVNMVNEEMGSSDDDDQTSDNSSEDEATPSTKDAAALADEPVKSDVGEALLPQKRQVRDDDILFAEGPPKRSVKLGLGDFVFYSVLVGRAALYDIVTVIACFIAIVTGLFFTLLLLAVFRKALPALPFSIALGTIFYFLTKVFLLPFVLELGLYGMFI